MTNRLEPTPPKVRLGRENIRAFHGESADKPHHRYRSWEHCFHYFHNSTLEYVAQNRNISALHLGFYLASWGMYRGSSFLLQHTYTVHLGVIDHLVTPRFAQLREQEFGASDYDTYLVPLILEAVATIRKAYRPNRVTDTLASKIMLGIFGCIPACDTYFIDGWKKSGLPYSSLNDRFVQRTLTICRDNIADLLEAQKHIKASGGVHYPLMKLVDMHFWQIGAGHSTISPAHVRERAPRAPRS